MKFKKLDSGYRGVKTGSLIVENAGDDSLYFIVEEGDEIYVACVPFNKAIKVAKAILKEAEA